MQAGKLAIVSRGESVYEIGLKGWSGRKEKLLSKIAELKAKVKSLEKK